MRKIKKPTFIDDYLLSMENKLLDFSVVNGSFIEKCPKIIRPLLIILRQIRRPFRQLAIMIKSRYFYSYTEGAMGTHHSVAFIDKERFQNAYKKAVGSLGRVPRGGGNLEFIRRHGQPGPVGI